MRAFLLTIAAAATIAATDPSTPLTPAETRATVEEVAVKLIELYPFPTIAADYARTIRTRDAAGAYADLDPPAFAKLVAADLQARHRDKHLGVLFRPETNGDEGEAADAHPSPPRTAASLRVGHGLKPAEIDPATSTAYLQSVGGWTKDEATVSSIAAAMAQSAGARNVIIDVRGCGGGDGAVGRLLGAYFFKPGDQHFYLDGYYRDGRREEEWTQKQVRGPTLPAARLFILIDQSVASACEGFAFAMQQMKRATVVGDTSAGAGMQVHPTPVGHGLVLWVPDKMIYAPGTRRGWEGIGVVPDIAAHGRDAREVAMEVIGRASATPRTPR